MKVRKVVRDFYAFANILVYCFLLSTVGETTELPRCVDARDVPERVTVAYFRVIDSAIPVTSTELQHVQELSLELFNREQSLNNDTIVSVESVVKQFSNFQDTEALETSKFAMQLSLDTLDNRTLREDMNLVAVTGGGLSHMSEAINLVSQMYGYPHLDITDGGSLSNAARFPMFARIIHSDYVHSKAILELLRELEICRVVLVSSFLYTDAASQFSKEAEENGIDVVDHISSITSNNHQVKAEEAINTIVENHVHFVVTFVEELTFPQLLGHVRVSHQLKEQEFEIVWIGMPIFRIFALYPYANLIATNYYRRITDVFAENNITYEEVINELQGSFDAHVLLPSGPVAEHFTAGMKNSEFSQLNPTSLMTFEGDMYLAVAKGIRAMNANGYGCFLHSENFNALVAKKLYETIIAQKFWGNSGWVEFDDNGDRKVQMHVVNYHRGHSEEDMDPFYYSPILHDPVAIPSVVGTYDPSELNTQTNIRRTEEDGFEQYGKLILDTNKTIIWPAGTSLENPGTKPGHPTDPPCQISASVQFEYVDKEGVYLHPWVIAVLCVSGVVVLSATCFLYRKTRKLEKSMKEMDAGRRVFDLEAPLEKVNKMIKELIEGKVPKKPELESLKEMLASGNIMTPKLEKQLVDVDGDAYSPDSIQFVLNNMLPKVNKFIFKRKRSSKKSIDFAKLTPGFGNSRLAVISDLHETQSRVIGRQAPAWDFFGKAYVSPATDIQYDELKSKLPCLDAPGLHRFSLMQPLEHVAMNVLDVTLNLVQTLNLDREKLRKFLQVIEDGYHASNPYHNRAHAADVTARFAAIISHSKLDRVFVAEELLGGIIAAIIHDYQHPGSSNNFQIQAKTAVSMIYNEDHILEHASLFTALELLEHPEYRFTENISKTSMKGIKSIIIQCVLATDISEHFNILSDFKSKVPPGSCEGDVEAEQKSLILKMALKCADLGHTTVNLSEHLLWVNSLQTEFYLQGDCERELGLPISMLMDRSKHRNGPAHGEQQLGFFDFICFPMYEAWVERFPGCSLLTQNLSENRKYWDENAKEAKDVIHTIAV